MKFRFSELKYFELGRQKLYIVSCKKNIKLTLLCINTVQMLTIILKLKNFPRGKA